MSIAAWWGPVRARGKRGAARRWHCRRRRRGGRRNSPPSPARNVRSPGLASASRNEASERLRQRRHHRYLGARKESRTARDQRLDLRGAEKVRIRAGDVFETVRHRLAALLHRTHAIAGVLNKSDRRMQQLVMVELKRQV